MKKMSDVYTCKLFQRTAITCAISAALLAGCGAERRSSAENRGHAGKGASTLATDGDADSAEVFTPAYDEETQLSGQGDLQEGAPIAAPATLAGLSQTQTFAQWDDVNNWGEMAQRCIQQKGTWNARLQSCRCPEGQLFALGGGCESAPTPRAEAGCNGPLGKMTAEVQAQCARSLMVGELQLNLDLTAVAEADRKKVLDGLDSAVSNQLPGITLPIADSGYHLTLTNRLSATLPSLLAMWTDETHFPQANHYTSPWSPVLHSKNETSACTQALTPLSSEAANLCKVAAAARSSLIHVGKPALRWQNIAAFSDNDGQVMLAAQAQKLKMGILYRVHVKSGLPLQRHLQIQGTTGRLVVFLASQGNVDATAWVPINGNTTFFAPKWRTVVTSDTSS